MSSELSLFLMNIFVVRLIFYVKSKIRNSNIYKINKSRKEYMNYDKNWNLMKFIAANKDDVKCI